MDLDMGINTISKIEPESKKRKHSEISSSLQGQFTVTMDSLAEGYYPIVKFITQIHIDQNTLNELSFTGVDSGDNRDIIYEIPEDIDITIYYKNETVVCHRSKISKDHGTSRNVEYLYGLSLKAKSKEILDALLLDAVNTKTTQMIYYYKPTQNYWAKHGFVQPRSPESLVMDKNTMTDLFDDITLFYSDESEAEYIYYGQPYKRNYLFHGKPGTGKSSLVSIIASKWNRNIYIICFDPSLTDSSLMSAYSSITDDKAILLLEDIDCVFQKRDVDIGGASITAAPVSKASVNYSTIFNVLDGVPKVKGMLTIITTNFIEKLDKALLRPGRVDKMIKFDTISEQQLLDLLKIYSRDLKKVNIDKIYTMCKDRDLVPAVISSFLFRHRRQKFTDTELINHFKKYLEEIDLVYSKKTHNSSYL